jgi:hypothetical protein
MSDSEENSDNVQSSSVQALKESFEKHLMNSLGQDRYGATPRGQYSSLALATRD